MRVSPLHAFEAKAISEWRYPGPFLPYQRSAESLQPLALCFGVHDSTDELIGYLTLGPAAQLHGTVDNDSNALAITFALHPLRMRQGYGVDFVRTVCAFADHYASNIGVEYLRTAVDDWNFVAINVCREVGFEASPPVRSQLVTLRRAVKATALSAQVNGHYLG